MAPNPEYAQLLEQAQEAKKVNPARCEALYKQILSDGPGSGDAALRDYEAALMGLGELYRDHKKANELAELVRTSRSTLSSFAKAKTAKIGPFMYSVTLQTSGRPNSIQSVSSSIYFPRYRTRPTSRFPSQNHASNGLSRNGDLFYARASRLAW